MSAPSQILNYGFLNFHQLFYKLCRCTPLSDDILVLGRYLIQCGICILLKCHIQMPVHAFHCPMPPYCTIEQFDIFTKAMLLLIIRTFAHGSFFTSGSSVCFFLHLLHPRFLQIILKKLRQKCPRIAKNIILGGLNGVFGI